MIIGNYALLSMHQIMSSGAKWNNCVKFIQSNIAARIIVTSMRLFVDRHNKVEKLLFALLTEFNGTSEWLVN